MPLTPEENLSNIRQVFGWDSKEAIICMLCNDIDKLKAENERLRKGLEAVVKHQEFVCGGKDKLAAKLSGTLHIACKALETP